MSAPLSPVPGDTVAAAVRSGAARLAAAGIDDARREARLLVAAALDCETTAIIAHPERVLTRDEAVRLAEFVGRRVARQPAARILGHREFWSLDLTLSPEALVPRPDSETVIEAVLEALPDRTAPLRILDLGTGSGCLVLALLSEYKQAIGFGVDLSPGAATTARRNAGALGLAERTHFVVGCWGQVFLPAFDVIVSNPPYIRADAIVALEPEVARHEPHLALNGGTDGLDAYRGLVSEIGRLLRPGGLAALEVGAGQAAEVTALMAQGRLVPRAIRRDLAGIERCVVLEKPIGDPQ
jgi:release factor glutamine methyltransferase